MVRWIDDLTEFGKISRDLIIVVTAIDAKSVYMILRGANNLTYV